MLEPYQCKHSYNPDRLDEMTLKLTTVESWSLLGLTVASLGIITKTFHGNGEPLIAALAFSGIAFALTFSLIRWLGDTFMRANLKGKDMSKIKKVEMSVNFFRIPF